ncbi:hypothetical protein INT48_006081 [Thamnidium elegans]|uniref:Uncharacterized protein n=1 Tax=Thamnidium elegans TaxID=101142 RepID=A0A8H7SH65_9FUNG|nr:hypothetical protein INT48_006081 [Thamnidium elegans]
MAPSIQKEVPPKEDLKTSSVNSREVNSSVASKNQKEALSTLTSAENAPTFCSVTCTSMFVQRRFPLSELTGNVHIPKYSIRDSPYEPILMFKKRSSRYISAANEGPY